jgi:CheY-like chemotaxis protein
MSGRVLIVEDDPGIREALADVLADCDMTTLLAANGLEALKVLEREALPDVILLDIMMPVMNGWDFRAKQRMTPRLASIPVIVLTANATAQDWAERMDAAAFLKKPVDLETLIDTIRRCGKPAAS